jgi:imidazolonepropionase
MTTTLWRGARLVTLADARGWGLVERGALLVDGDTIAWAGADADLPASTRADDEIDLGGALVTPGLVDCHTHLVYAGQRAGEFEQRLEGASYEDIARAGGGIRSTVAATRAASDETLFDLARERALALMSEGVTTIEIKSGYGLSAEHEARCLRVARRLGRELPLDVRTTCLSAHALPPEYAGRADEYIDAGLRLAAGAARRGLVDAVDGFCDRIGFSAEADPARLRRGATARPAGQAARRATERPAQRGARAEYGALSCDHLEYAGADGVAAMAAAGTVAVLLPGAFYFLRETRPAAGRRVACRRRADRDRHRPQPGLVADALAAADAEHGVHAVPADARGSAARMTVHAARALGLGDRGTLARESVPTSSSGTLRIERARLLVRAQSVRSRRRRRRRAMSEPVFTLDRGTAPLLLSLPHVGTAIPDDLVPCSCRARSRSRTPTGTSPRSTASRASSMPACSCRASRAT